MYNSFLAWANVFASCDVIIMLGVLDIILCKNITVSYDSIIILDAVNIKLWIHTSLSWTRPMYSVILSLYQTYILLYHAQASLFCVNYKIKIISCAFIIYLNSFNNLLIIHIFISWTNSIVSSDFIMILGKRNIMLCIHTIISSADIIFCYSALFRCIHMTVRYACRVLYRG